MVHGHIGDVPGGPQHQPDDIGVGVLIADHVLHYEALGREIAGDVQIRGLSQHGAGHPLVDLAAQVPECGVLLVVISGVHGVIPLLQLVYEPVHLIGRSLPVVVQAYHIIPVRVAQPRHQRRVLAEVPGEVHAPDIVVGGAQGPDGLQRTVGGAVVHQEDIVPVLLHGLHFFIDFRYHMGERVLRAIAGYHKADLLHLSCPLLLFTPACPSGSISPI